MSDERLQERVARALVPPIHDDEDRSDQDYDDVDPERFLRCADAVLAALGLDDLDAAAIRMREVLEHPGTRGSTRGSLLRVRHALEAALMPATPNTSEDPQALGDDR